MNFYTHVPDAEEIATAWQTAVGLTPESYGLDYLRRQQHSGVSSGPAD